VWKSTGNDKTILIACVIKASCWSGRMGETTANF